jgi:hypothetical protein
MAKIITVVIDEGGDQSVDCAGYQGTGCSAVQKAFEAAVGKSVKATKKPDYFKQAKTNTLQR